MKKLLGVLAVAALVASACGGSGSDSTNPGALEDVVVGQCVQVPVTVPGISVPIVGQRVQSISDLKVCVDAAVRVGLVPQLINQPDCGDPCFTVEVRNFDVAADEKVVITYKQDGVPQQQVVDPDPVNPTNGEERSRLCVIGIGTPDPCIERVTTPKSMTATAGRQQIQLKWSPAQDTGNGNLQGYDIYRSLTGEEGSFAPLGSVSETQHLDLGLTKGQQYWYYVVAFDADGNRSGASSTATAISR